MPMFDDPNKELHRMQKELLSDDSFDDLADLDDLLKDYEPTVLEDRFEEAPKAKETFKRPKASKNPTETMSEMLQDEDDDDEEDEEIHPRKPKKEKGIAGLVALCVLETVAIVGLLAWWLLCLR